MKKVKTKKLNTTSIVVVVIAGALTAFLWLPLLPLIVPMVTLALGLRWASSLLVSEAGFGKSQSPFKLLQFPSQNVSPNQAPKAAWPSSANLSSPARAGSLPSHRDQKSSKRQLRESRKIARMMNGLDLRKSAPGF